MDTTEFRPAPARLFLRSTEVRARPEFPKGNNYPRIIRPMPHLGPFRYALIPALYVTGLTDTLGTVWTSTPASEKHALIPRYNSSDVARLAVEMTMRAFAERIRISNGFETDQVTIRQVAGAIGCGQGVIERHTKNNPELIAAGSQSKLSKMAVLNCYRLFYPDQLDIEVPGQEPLSGTEED